METELRGKLEPMENQPVRCLIFDCDGTLVDSEFLSHVGFTQALSEIGVSLTPETSMERYRGGKLADMLQDAAGSTIDFAARYYEIISVPWLNFPSLLGRRSKASESRQKSSYRSCQL
jgi:phosphoglycolate phosphatase-like HAD superfamily hydrolase